MQGSEKENKQGKGTKYGNGTGQGKGMGKGNATEEWKGKGKGNGKEKGIVKQTPEGDDISHAVALKWQKELYEADLHTEG